MKGISGIIFTGLFILAAAKAMGDPEREIDEIAGHQRKNVQENDDYNAAEYIGKPSVYKSGVHQFKNLPFHHAPFSMIKMLGLAHKNIPSAMNHIQSILRDSAPTQLEDEPVLESRGSEPAGPMLDLGEVSPGNMDYPHGISQDQAKGAPYQHLQDLKEPFDEEENGPLIVPQDLELGDTEKNRLAQVDENTKVASDKENDIQESREDELQKDADEKLQESLDEDSDEDSEEDVEGPYPHPPAPAALRQDEESAHGAGIHTSLHSIYFMAVVAGCSIAGVVGLIVAGVCWYRLQKNVKAASEVDYPAYGVTGPTNGKERVGSPGDRKLAQSAQMYHYQHQKQQMIAMEKAHGDLNKDGSDVDSEEENEEGDYTVFECPGLAPTGEMEVKNPLFSEDTPVTPSTGDTRTEHK